MSKKNSKVSKKFICIMIIMVLAVLISLIIFKIRDARKPSDCIMPGAVTSAYSSAPICKL